MSSGDNSHFNRNELIAYRIQNKLSREDLAKLIGSKEHTVYYWESGQRTPLPKSVDRMVEGTGIPHSRFYRVIEDSLGRKLATLRLKNNISQIEMAERLGTSIENISRWEADVHTPSAYYLYQMAKELDITLEDLLTNKEGELIIQNPYDLPSNKSTKKTRK